MKHLTLTDAGLDMIADYEHIEFMGKQVRSPYYMNKRKQKGGLRVMVGKGDPQEIEREVQVLAQVKGFDLENSSAEDVRSFLRECDIGIDCSGFVVHVINAILADKNMGTIDQYLEFKDNGPVARVRRLLRTVENIGANTLTGPANTKTISFKEVRPGDLIRSKGKQKNSHHVLLVESVSLDNDIVQSFGYVHSAEEYGDDNGIRHGKVVITKPDAELKDQDWQEVKDGRNWTFEGLSKEYEDNGLRRLTRVSIPYVEQS